MMMNKKDIYLEFTKKNMAMRKNNKQIYNMVKYNNIFQYLYLCFVYFYINFLIYIGVAKQNLVPETESEKYINSKKKSFLKYHDDKEKSANIDDVFHSRYDYKKIMLDANNYLEKTWKTRILFEHTFQGNVLMFYDAFKEGFAYYSDQYVSYDSLNAIAMKYVMVFKCYDFFIDNSITQVESPFLKYVKEEENDETHKKKESIKQMLVQNTENPFAKFKNYNTFSVKSSEPATKVDDEEKMFYKNKFINLGKIHNFSFIQKMDKMKIKPIPLIQTKKYFENNEKAHEFFNKDSDLKIEDIFSSYGNYKNFKNKQKIMCCF
jgi:hypothetical protein